MSDPIAEAVARACGGTVAAARRVPGGDINQAMRVELTDGRVLFVKHRDDAPAGMYAAEAAGLRRLAEADAIPVPEPVAVDERFLALAWVDGAARGDGFDERLGRGIAALHAAGEPEFGGRCFIGPLEMPAATSDAWHVVYGEHRLAPLLRLASDAGALPHGTVGAVERVIGRLGEVCGPPEPPARLHGDLWTGNVMAGPGGGPWLVDPAWYGGHREIDLAMLQLFGSPSRAFFDAYDEALPRAAGHAGRVALFQLLPLLVHAVLFGGGYGASVKHAAERYV
jgi:fructosamine-3-kinase